MMDERDQDNIHAQFSLLDEQSRKRRQKSIVQTIVLVAITGFLVLRLAKDIVDKQMQVQNVEKSRGELDQKLKSEQEKLDAAIRTREKLEGEIKDLEATKRSYQNRILGEKQASANGGTGAGKPAPTSENQIPNSPNGRDPVDDAGEAPDVTTPIIEEVGKKPEGFTIKPNVIVLQGTGISGREIFKVSLMLEVPEHHRANVERVSYHLSPKYYLKNMIDGGGAPNFEAKFNVFACESTVLARVLLRDGTMLAVDFDWCREPGWPVPKREPVIVNAEDAKTPPNPSPPLPEPQRTPGITIPRLNSEDPGGGRRVP
jgi:hypothetical protein